MIIVLGMFLGVGFFVWVLWRRHKRLNEPGPLAGYDTGVRSPYRTPARFFHNRRTL